PWHAVGGVGQTRALHGSWPGVGANEFRVGKRQGREMIVDRDHDCGLDALLDSAKNGLYVPHSNLPVVRRFPPMNRWLYCAAALFAAVATTSADEITGQYVEARTCDVYTGPCFANADTGLAGRHAVLAWKIDKGTVDGTKLDGLGIVAVVAARDTL